MASSPRDALSRIPLSVSVAHVCGERDRDQIEAVLMQSRERCASYPTYPEPKRPLPASIMGGAAAEMGEELQGGGVVDRTGEIAVRVGRVLLEMGVPAEELSPVVLLDISSRFESFDAVINHYLDNRELLDSLTKKTQDTGEKTIVDLTDGGADHDDCAGNRVREITIAGVSSQQSSSGAAAFVADISASKLALDVDSAYEYSDEPIPDPYCTPSHDPYSTAISSTPALLEPFSTHITLVDGEIPPPSVMEMRDDGVETRPQLTEHAGRYGTDGYGASAPAIAPPPPPPPPLTPPPYDSATSRAHALLLSTLSSIRCHSAWPSTLIPAPNTADTVAGTMTGAAAAAATVSTLSVASQEAQKAAVDAVVGTPSGGILEVTARDDKPPEVVGSAETGSMNTAAAVSTTDSSSATDAAAATSLFPVLVEFVPPGCIVHIRNQHKGRLRASVISHNHPTLKSLTLILSQMLNDHSMHAMSGALRSVRRQATYQRHPLPNGDSFPALEELNYLQSIVAGDAAISSVEEFGEGGKVSTENAQANRCTEDSLLKSSVN